MEEPADERACVHIYPHLCFLFWRNLCSDAFLAMGMSGSAAGGLAAAGFSSSVAAAAGAALFCGGVAEEPDPASCISSSALLAGKSSNTSTLPSYTMVRGAFGLETKYAYSPSSNPTYEALISAVGNIKGQAIYSIYREVASRS